MKHKANFYYNNIMKDNQDMLVIIT